MSITLEVAALHVEMENGHQAFHYVSQVHKPVPM